MQISHVKWSSFNNTVTATFFAFFIQIVIANNVGQFSNLGKLQNDQKYQCRYKRGIIFPPTPSTNPSTLVLTLNQISKLQEKIGLNSSTSLNEEDKLKIALLETVIKDLEKNQAILRKELMDKDNVMTSITQKLNTVLFHDIVHNIQSKQFSLAENQLKSVDDANYENIVEAVYNRNADNIDLLRSYGGFITDIERKIKVYDALLTQMKANGHLDVWKLIRLAQAVEKEILDHSSNATAAQSLFNNLLNAIQSAAIKTITISFLNNKSWSNINSLSATLMNDFPQSLISNIYKAVIERIFNALDIQEVINGTNKINHLESEMIILEALYDKLEGVELLNTNNKPDSKNTDIASELNLLNWYVHHFEVIFLSNAMKSLTNRDGYQSVSSERRTTYENKKEKLILFLS